MVVRKLLQRLVAGAPFRRAYHIQRSPCRRSLTAALACPNRSRDPPKSPTRSGVQSLPTPTVSASITLITLWSEFKPYLHPKQPIGALITPTKLNLCINMRQCLVLRRGLIRGQYCGLIQGFCLCARELFKVRLTSSLSSASTETTLFPPPLIEWHAVPRDDHSVPVLACLSARQIIRNSDAGAVRPIAAGQQGIFRRILLRYWYCSIPRP